jgi:hypothetical protein
MNNAKNYPINCGTISSPPQWAFRKKPLNERNFEIIANEVLRITENGSVEFTTYKDLLLRNESFASYVSDFNVTASFLVPNYYEPITISSENTNVLTINESTNAAIASFESEGSCIIKGASPSGETSLCKVNAQEYISQDVTTFLGYTNDSLAFNVTNAVDQRIVGKNSSHRPLYTTQNHASSIYVRNPDCLLSDIDLTCLSPWNSEGQTFMGGILVSPYHVLYCTHFGFYPNVGHTVRFITQNNTVVTRTITATLAHPDYDDSNYNYSYDFTLIKLDEKIDPVVDGISCAHVLPANWADYLPSLSRSHTIPVFGTNQFERVTISQECDFLGTNFAGLPPTGARASFYEGMIRFDSGSPQFIIVNDQVVVLGPVTGAGSGNGSFVSYHMTVLNNMMQQLGGLDENGDPYQLSVVDLSMFSSYAIIPPETYNEIVSGGASSGGSAIAMRITDYFYQQNSDVVFDLRIEADARAELKKIPDTYFASRESVVLYEPSKFLEPTVLYSVANDWKQAYTDVKLKLSYNNNLGTAIKHNETIVGVRVKGYGSFKPYNRKVPLRIKSTNGISGLGSTKDVTLNNMAQSGSKISEYIIYKIFQDYGMPCPRANYVRLFINDSTVTISSISSNLLTTTANHYLFEDMRIKFVSLSGISDDQIFYVIERTDTTFKVSETLGGSEYSLPNFSGNLEFYIDYGEYVNVENPKNDYNLNENFGANNTKHLYEINITTTGQELVAQSYAYDLSYGDNDRSDLINFIQKLSSSSNWYQNISTCIDVQQFIKFSVMELYCGQPDGYCNFLNNSYLHSDSNGVFRLTPWGSDTYFTNGGLLSMDLPWSTWMQKCWAYKETLDIFKTELVSFHNWLQNSSGILNTIELIFNQKIQDFESDKKKPETETTAQATQAKNDMISFIQSRQDAVDAFLSRPYPPANFNAIFSDDSIILSWDHVLKNVNGDDISGVIYNIYAGTENNLKFFTGPYDFLGLGTELATNSSSLFVGENFSNTVYFAVAALHNGTLGFFSEIAGLNPPSEPPTPDPLPLIRITEVMSNGASGTPDWFELKNISATSVDITGWKIDDASGNFDYAVAMNPDGWSTISTGEVVVFFELSGAINTSGVFVSSPSTSTQITNFKNFWNIGSGPTNIRNVKIGTYGGSGVGLGKDGDGVVVFNSTGQEVTRVDFGSATAGRSFNWQYDSSGNATSSAVISQVGVNGAYQRVFNIASPGVA